MQPSPLLRVEGLARSYRSPAGETRAVLHDVSFEVQAGELVAILGESGVGKSTLLQLIGGLDQADRGRIVLDGQDLSLLSDDARTRLRARSLGFVFQAFHILPHLTVAQNVALPLLLQDPPWTGNLQQRVDELLDSVGLSGRNADLPGHLSGGQLQRVAIARALVHRPQLILADEPTGNLDPDTAVRVLDLLQKCMREHSAACLLVTHSVDAAARADRRLRLTPSGIAAQ